MWIEGLSDSISMSILKEFRKIISVVWNGFEEKGVLCS
jgi:hypothetical protein